MLNDDYNVIQRNRRHRKRINSNFVKTENDNNIETKPKTKHGKSAYVPEEVNKPSRECDWTSISIELHNSIRKKSNQTISIWWVASNENIICKGRILCATISSTILLVFVCSTSIVFMLLRYFAITSYLFYSHTNVLPIHFIYHSPCHSFHLP